MIQTPLEHHQLATNGISLHVVQAGPSDGPVAILLHGFPEYWMAWGGQIDALVALGYRVWLPDQRGYNTSDKPAGVEAYRPDQLVADIMGLIDQSGRAQVLLFGHDWGGAIAWEVARRHPERLTQLVIANMPHPQVMRRQLRKSLAQLRKSWYIFLFQLPRLPEWLLGRANFAALDKTLRSTSRAGSFSPADLAAYHEAWRRPGALTGMLNWYRTIFSAPPATRPHVRRDPRIRVPTLLIWGTRDHALGTPMAQPSIALCDEGQLALIDTAGHWVLHEEAQRVATLIAQFLRDTDCGLRLAQETAQAGEFKN